MSTLDLTFPRHWTAEVLPRRPLILPPRRFTYPHEEEEIERGALEVLVRPATSDPFLGTFALGFADAAAPTGVWSCPDPNWICAVAGGYAYMVDTTDPRQFTQLPYRPVLQVHPLPDHQMLLFASHRTLLAWGGRGKLWETAQLSSEGLEIKRIEGHELHGLGWDMRTDRELPFVVNLTTGTHTGGVG